MKKLFKNINFRIFSILCLLALCMGTAYGTWLVFSDAKKSIDTNSSEVVDNSDMVDVNLYYLVYTNLEQATQDNGYVSGYENVTISSKTDWTNYLQWISDNTTTTPESRTAETILGAPTETTNKSESGTNTYIAKSDENTRYAIIYNVTFICTVKEETDLCGDITYKRTYSYSGSYSITSYTILYSYYETELFNSNVYDVLSIPRNTALTHDMIYPYVQGTSGYTFVGLAKSYDADGFPTEYYNFSDSITDDSTTFYAVLNKDDQLGKNSIYKTINEASQDSGTLMFYYDENYSNNIGNDESYYEGIKSFGLGRNTETGYTTIASGVTVDFCLNTGILYSTTEGTPAIIDPEGTYDPNYTIILQNDLYIYGTLELGGIHAVRANTKEQGYIYQDNYVTLDLNGHDIYMYSGSTLVSYGLIKDSVGTGTIYNTNGTIKTVAVIFDNKGGSSSLSAYGSKIFPFQIYHLPYLRCTVKFVFDSTNNSWGTFTAFAVVEVMEGSEIQTVELNFLGDAEESSNHYLFAIKHPDGTRTSSNEEASVVFSYTKNEAMDAENDNQVKTYCLSARLGFDFNNIDVILDKIVFEMTVYLTVPIDTSEMVFPLPSFFDVNLFNSSITFSQKVQFLPGSSLYADKNSVIYLDNTTGNKTAEVYALDTPAQYYKNGVFIEKDHSANLSSANEYCNAGALFTSKVFWKYYHSATITCHGKVILAPNSSSYPYILSGNINIAQIGTDVNNCYDSVTEMMSNVSNVYLRTYGYTFLNYNSGNTIRGYTMPLTSFGRSYVFNNTSADSSYSLEGTYDQQYYIFTDSNNNTYYFNAGTSSSFSSSATVTSCTIVDDGIILVGSQNYVAYSGLYWSTTYTLQESVCQINNTRLNSSFSTSNLYFKNDVWQR